MPTFSNFTVQDRETTPNDFRFDPLSNREGVAKWSVKGNSIIGDPTITCSVRKTTSNLTKVKLVIAVPTVVQETVNGVTRDVVESTSYGNLELTWPETSTEQSRSNLMGFLEDCVKANRPQINDMIVCLESAY